MRVTRRPFQNVHVWMLVTADPTSPNIDDIRLTVHWNPVGDKHRPTHADLKDPLLWGIWQLMSDMVFQVQRSHSDPEVFTSRKEALARFHQLARWIPRRKKIYYGFPVDGLSD